MVRPPGCGCVTGLFRCPGLERVNGPPSATRVKVTGDLARYWPASNLSASLFNVFAQRAIWFLLWECAALSWAEAPSRHCRTGPWRRPKQTFEPDADPVRPTPLPAGEEEEEEEVERRGVKGNRWQMFADEVPSCTDRKPLLSWGRGWREVEVRATVSRTSGGRGAAVTESHRSRQGLVL